MNFDFKEQWYKDEDVQTMIQQIYKVMEKYKIDAMGFNSNCNIEKYLCNIYAGKPVEHKIITGYDMGMFHLEFNEGQITIDL